MGRTAETVADLFFWGGSEAPEKSKEKRMRQDGQAENISKFNLLCVFIL